jgi:hypothetical protein
MKLLKTIVKAVLEGRAAYVSYKMKQAGVMK